MAAAAVANRLKSYRSANPRLTRFYLHTSAQIGWRTRHIRRIQAPILTDCRRILPLPLFHSFVSLIQQPHDHLIDDDGDDHADSDSGDIPVGPGIRRRSAAATPSDNDDTYDND